MSLVAPRTVIPEEEIIMAGLDSSLKLHGVREVEFIRGAEIL
jgi:hypothetical protein